MTQKTRLWGGLLLLAVLVTLVVAQGSFTLGDYGPATPASALVFWGLSTLIFLLTVLVAFMLFRDSAKLWLARRSNREGSRIRTKIVVAALSLCLLPTIFLVLWSVEVLNRNLDKWFSRPAEGIRMNLVEIGEALEREAARTAHAQASWLADSEALKLFLATGNRPTGYFEKVCAAGGAAEAFVRRPDGGQVALCRDETNEPPAPGRAGVGKEVTAEAPLSGGGAVVLRSRVAVDIARSEKMIRGQVDNYDQLAVNKKEMRLFYVQLLLLITLFILFVTLWVAMLLARQIAGPITALLEAAREVRGGNLAHRIRAPAADEFATLVRTFNEMTQDLEANRAEIERRRRFMEAVLESIPSGVISLAHDGRIQLINGALRQMFPEERLRASERLSDLVPAEQQADYSRLMKRARRLGVANRQMEWKDGGRIRHLSVTAAALDEKVTSGFVLVLEDTSDVLHAQRMAAWHEVARRVAHEIKNPLTPIALCSERIARQTERVKDPPDVKRVLLECSAVIGREVESVRSLVDEFSQYARFPAASPVPGDLNEVVEESLAAFAGRLAGIEIRKELAPALPAVAIDREQFKRAIVNLVDNAAEAMQESPLKRVLIATSSASPETVELVVADTGPGIQPEDKEKLFLPYFSTKKRGTGLGLAIVSHIVAEHGARIRVEDNLPLGARFIIEMPGAAAPETDARTQEVEA